MSKLSKAILGNLRKRSELKKRYNAGDKTALKLAHPSNIEIYQHTGSTGSHDVEAYSPTDTESSSD